ncbi:uncharacterized protein RCO7_14303 [Rhynchosporium graminicola]|uniref:Uncharacterized protein n=1 Tax=Rhynchosporium graminicola TaxID=2792576 RepID=A0A1E1KBA6_9HELO|nr:uncharacterized protein RCO7_14303 [Rhynchosporium commune]
MDLVVKTFDDARTSNRDGLQAAKALLQLTTKDCPPAVIPKIPSSSDAEL